ncbi:MAG TPA: phage terminase small subunit P27 family [Terriglobia bacterium]|nr:phage terminase small subunit P27 family [Terriglobia bacterium]
MRGRKPTPTSLKALAGNPGKRPLDAEPSVVAEIPSCPQHVRGVARKEWKRICPALASLGLISRLDRAAIAAYCVEFARWVEAEEKVHELGLMCVPDRVARDGAIELFPNSRTPNPEQLIWNPYLAIAAKSMERMMKILAEFGMTPSSRVRLKGLGDPVDDPTENFLFGSEGERESVQ